MVTTDRELSEISEERVCAGAPAMFPVPYLPAALARVVPLAAAETVELTAVRCRRCSSTGSIVCVDGTEVRCIACDGVGWQRVVPVVPMSAVRLVSLAAD